MDAATWLQQATQQLRAAGIETARLDALVLLEDFTHHDRAYVLSHPETYIAADQLEQLKKVLNRRANHEPLAYIRHKSEFYGRCFAVGPSVLVPRPESELIIELLFALIGPLPAQITKPEPRDIWRIADVGAGSGALGITAHLELPNTQVELLEIDAAALKTAQINVNEFTTSISIKQSDLLAGSTQDNDILLCNLPYVPDEYLINQAAGFEPAIALYGGHDGLNLFRRLFKQIDELDYKPLYILTEALPATHSTLTSLANKSNYNEVTVDDFVQLFQLRK